MWAQALELALDAEVSPFGPTIRILSVSPSGAQIEVELRFATGQSYCCTEAGCFLSGGQPFWRRIRAALRDMTGRDPPLMSLTIRGVVEDKALLRSEPPGGTPTETAAHTYDSGPIRERRVPSRRKQSRP